MPLYRKKPVEIEAVQWTGLNVNEILEFTKSRDNLYFQEIPQSNLTRMFVRTLEGDMQAHINDFIIKGIKGEFYPCKPDIFHLTYEEVL